MKTDNALPIVSVLPRLRTAIRKGPVILSAPTGSGKTTVIPPALIGEDWLAEKKIIMLEPRRIAARAAAARMSEILGEPVGQTVGYRIRFDSRVTDATRIEVVTEGILTRTLQNDPGLSGVGLVIFDEFHERSLHADLGLALCLDLCRLRDDLRILIMSATIDSKPLARLLERAEVISGEGKAHPVTVSYLPPTPADTAIAGNTARGIEHALQKCKGDILAFLPGAGEIRATMDLLSGRFQKVDILPLYGELSHADQDRVLRYQSRRNRRVILATPIAETSITIEGIGCVVDSGFAKRPRFNPATGLERLDTIRISRASAEQRRGRAGRLGPGHCFRLWSHEIDQGLLSFTPPEIVTTDLSSLGLELALWGVTDPAQLKWLDPPRTGSWNKAQALLKSIGAVDHMGRITDTGIRLARLPVHPRLGTMLLAAVKLQQGATACILAALLSERDPFKGRNRTCDLRQRLALFRAPSSRLSCKTAPRGLTRIIQQSNQLKNLLHLDPEEPIRPETCGLLLSFAYPDRLALLRPGQRTSYQLSTGRSIHLPEGDLLAATPLLVVAQLDEGRGQGRIQLAAQVTEEELRRHQPQLFSTRNVIRWDQSSERVRAMIEACLGRIALSQAPHAHPRGEEVQAVFLAEVQKRGMPQLPWTDETRQLQVRVELMRALEGEKWPDISDKTLAADLAWLSPYCEEMTGFSELKQLNLKKVLQGLLPWNLQQQLIQDLPTHIAVPSGSKKRLIYHLDNTAVLAVRLQEMFGCSSTPTVGNRAVKIILHLLSPANRPIQITSDLASFWTTTYPQVKKELAGRYPKHYWPDDPNQAQPTCRTKKAKGRKKK